MKWQTDTLRHSVLVPDGTDATLADAGTLTTTSPLGRTSTVRFDARGRPVEWTIPGVTPVSVTYDGRGRVLTTTQGPRTSTVAWGPNGFPANVTDPAAQKVAWTTDTTGQVKDVTTTGGAKLGLSSDKVGRLTASTAPSGAKTSWAYSALGAVTKWTPPLASGQVAETASYNADTAPTDVGHLDASKSTVTYDSAGRVKDWTSPWATTSVGWDTAGRLSSLTRGSQRLDYAWNGPLLLSETSTGDTPGSVAWAYDSATMRLTSQSVSAVPVAFGYDDDGLLTSAGTEVLTRDTANGRVVKATTGVVVEAWTYDSFGDLASQDVTVSGVPLFRRVLTRDTLGRVTKVDATQGGSTHSAGYGYDAENRLASETLDGAPAHSWTFDDDGHRLTADGVTSTYDATGRHMSAGATSLTWDAFASLASRTEGGHVVTYRVWLQT